MKNKVIAGIAAGLILLGLSAAPAHADVSNNTVTNRSQGWVTVIRDGGQQVSLAGYGAKTTNVDWVVVPPGACVSMNATKYCTPSYYSTVWVAVANNAQVTVARIS